jgi:hypothetical protein
MRSLQFILLIIGLVAAPATVVTGGVKPPNWPWRGVVVNSCCSGVDADSVPTIAGFGANAILLDIRARSRARLPGALPEKAWAESLNWVDRMLDACKKHGLVGIVRLTQLPIDPKKGFNEKSPQFWARDGDWHDAVRLAGVLGERFRSRGAELGAYAILSEPAMRFEGRTVKPSNWDRVQPMIIAAIREHDADRHIVVAPGPGGLPVNYRSFQPIDDPAIIYGAHMYVPHAFTHQGVGGRKTGLTYPGMIAGRYWDKAQLREALAQLRAFQQKTAAPVLIGEFSAVRDAPGATRYLSDIIEIFNEFGWGWTYFLYQGNPLWSVGETPASAQRWADKNLRQHYSSPTGRLELLQKMWHDSPQQRQPGQ